MTVVGIVLIIIFVVSVWNRIDERKARKKRAVQRKECFGTDQTGSRRNEWSRERLDEIAVYYEETKEDLPKTAVDAVTWSDLEMDEVFLRINQTESYVGEQVLYRRLHGGMWKPDENCAGEQVPCQGVHEAMQRPDERDTGACRKPDRGETPAGGGTKKSDRGETPAGSGAKGADRIETPAGWRRFEAKTAYMARQEAEREELQEALWQLGKLREDYYLPMFLKSAQMLRVEHLWVYRALQVLLAGSLAGALLLRHPLLIAVLIGTALFNLMIYTCSKEKYEVYLHALGSVRQLVCFCRMLAKKEEWRRLFLTKEQERVSERLEKLVRYIGAFQRKKAGVVTGNGFDLVTDYLVGMTLWDITSFARIAGILEGHQEELFLLYEACGEVDLAISVASFRASLPGYCLPECGETFVAKNLYHPLLSDPVCNDFAPQKHAIITGANASGKSTFLKAVAVNAILAQSIHTVAAEYAAMPRMRVITSMAVRDDLVAGESYYIREVTYLKRIVDAARSGQPVLCVIDEILRGTNTGERLAASEAVCRYLAVHAGLALVATHDMELAETMDGPYECYYFHSEIGEADIAFDYRIHAGRAGGQNAIRLLAYLDFPQEIVGMAEQLYADLIGRKPSPGPAVLPY